jgi:hypothetical protein
VTAAKGRATPGKSAKKPLKKSTPATKTGATKSAVSKAHKAALAQGRVEGRVIRSCLDVFEANRPKRGRKEMAPADTVTKLRLTRERTDLERELKVKKANADIGKLESQFVKAARASATRNGITHTAWREVGVSPRTSECAGISPDD